MKPKHSGPCRPLPARGRKLAGLCRHWKRSQAGGRPPRRRAGLPEGRCLCPRPSPDFRATKAEGGQRLPGRPALGLTKESLATFSLHSPMSWVSLPPLWGGGDWPGAPWELVAGQHGTVNHQCLSSPQSTVSRGPKEATAHHTPRRQAGHQVETRGRAPQVSGLACGWLIRVCLLGHGDTEARFLPGTLPRDTQLTRRAWGPQPGHHGGHSDRPQGERAEQLGCAS